MKSLFEKFFVVVFLLTFASGPAWGAVGECVPTGVPAGSILWEQKINGDVYGVVTILENAALDVQGMTASDGIFLAVPGHNTGSVLNLILDQGVSATLAYEQNYGIDNETSWAFANGLLYGNVLASAEADIIPEATLQALSSDNPPLSPQMMEGFVVVEPEDGGVRCATEGDSGADGGVTLFRAGSDYYAIRTDVVNPKTPELSDSGSLDILDRQTCARVGSYPTTGWGFASVRVVDGGDIAAYHDLAGIAGGSDLLFPDEMRLATAGNSIPNTDGVSEFGGRGFFSVFDISDPLSPELLWQREHDSVPNRSALPWVDPKSGGLSFIFATQGGEIFRVDALTGTILASFNFGSGSDTGTNGFAPLVFGARNETLAITFWTGNDEYKNSVVVVDSETLTPLWSEQAPSGQITPVFGVGKNGESILYVVTQYRDVVAFNADTGTILWTLELAAETFQGALSLSDCGVLYVPTNGTDGKGGLGSIVAIQTESLGLEPTSSCPKMQCDVQNTGTANLLAPLGVDTTDVTTEEDFSEDADMPASGSSLVPSGGCSLRTL